jgi:hypothetical protein
MGVLTPSGVPPEGLISRGASSFATMHQAPMPPWRNNEEANEYRDDPRAFLLARLALLMPLRVYHNWIITATYYMPDWDELGATGVKFYRSDKQHDEALWQGKVGLVIGKGPMAFLDDEHVRFYGQNVEIGDWVQYDIMEGRQFTLDRVHCRRLKDTQVVMNVPDPRLVY